MKKQPLPNETPLYHQEFYEDFYNNKDLCRFFDKYQVQRILTLGAYDDMAASVQKEISQGMRVLQLGLTFGHQITDIADRIGKKGQYDILDVNEARLQRARDKYLEEDYPMLNFIRHNAAEPYDKGYDAVICFQLLHEVPFPEKIKIVELALKSVSKDGAVIFVDYHRPVWCHPLRYFIRMFNRLYQPFAEKMWEVEISAMAVHRTDFNWTKTTFAHNLYQKVVARKKDAPAKIVGKLPQQSEGTD